MLKVILIDDELSAIKSLKWDIANFCPEVEVVESFTKPLEALQYLENHHPDVVFFRHRNAQDGWLPILRTDGGQTFYDCFCDGV